MIPKDTIDRILERTSIVEVINDFLPADGQLKRKGSSAKFWARCPFHDDHKPSFAVTDSMGIYKCFSCGEGGTVFTFLRKHEKMEFPEAIRYLGKKYGITVEEREESDEEKNKRLHREELLLLMERVAAFYVSQLQACKEAQAYAYGRWSDTFCAEMGIGFAPASGQALLSWTKQNQEKRELLQELDLIRQREDGDGFYDFYRGRIMIPIRDRLGRVLSFTARDITGRANTSKYLNGTDNLIYKKGETLFGLSLARSDTMKEGKVYAVEGAPDCLRLQMIGVHNTVAPLGTAWTSQQFDIIKRMASKICFLPDADPPKEGRAFGTGVEAVIKNGKEAVKSGFSVSVRPIPLGENGRKQDPDEYCRDRAHFQGLEERDFITWLAELRFNNAQTLEEKAKVVSELSELLAYIEDETVLSLLMDDVATLSGRKVNLWRDAVNKQRRLVTEKTGKGAVSKNKEIDLLARYGFYEKLGKYFSTTKDGEPWEWSNFTMKPLFHIRDNIMPKRLFYIRNEFGIQEMVELRQEELVSLQRFRQRVEGMGNFVWMATDKEFTRMKRFLYEVTETATEVKQLGWQRQGFFAFGNGIFTNGTFQKVDELGIVRIQGKGNFYLPAFSIQYRDDPKLYKMEKTFVHLDYSDIPLRDFIAQLFEVFGDNGRIGFCFLLATLFRDIVTDETRSFPLLNLFGPKGSGKSELGHTLMSFFIIDNIPPNIQNSTLPSLNDTVASVSNALVHIDEFKNDIDLYKREFLKGLWDGTGRTRMNMDLDKKKETTAVDSGIILSGQEMATADIALFSRLIYLTFSKSEFTETEKQNYQRLREMRSQGASHLTLQLLSYRPRMQSDFKRIYLDTLREISDALRDERIEDRILYNWVIPLAVFRTLEDVLDIPLSNITLRRITLNGIRLQNKECRTNNELAGFWQAVQFFVSEGELIPEGDFRIVYDTELKTDIQTVEWQEEHPVLLLQKSRIFTLYKKLGRQVGDKPLSESSLRYYLENSREYLGEKAAVRFKNFKGGIPQLAPMNSSTDRPRQLTTPQRAYCFDYKKLVESFQINMESSSLPEVD